MSRSGTDRAQQYRVLVNRLGFQLEGGKLPLEAATYVRIAQDALRKAAEVLDREYPKLHSDAA